MLFLGFMVTFLLRVNINLTIVGMVNSTVVQPVSDDLLPENSTSKCIHPGHPRVAMNGSIEKVFD